MPVCDVIIVSRISLMLCTVATVVIIILSVREHVCVASESLRIFSRDQSVHLRTQHRGSAKNPDYDM